MTFGIAFAAATLAYVLWPLFSRQWRVVQLPGDGFPGEPDDEEIERMILEYRRARPVCAICGLRRESAATFCSECGRALAPPETASALDQLEPPQRDADRDERRS